MKNKKISYADFNQAMDELENIVEDKSVSQSTKDYIAAEAEKMVEELVEMKKSEAVQGGKVTR